ncbi:hypothetical protein [Francisella philomiragia]|uniref:hypothetical protein n=1 Tax=Francisella philomiragia TaxID=28110 RepID=UPI001C9DAAB9|nr:hypothetical protein [Francisella philomiragia]MBY7733453.1 hypothetical protein [Francisella philomiragia]
MKISKIYLVFELVIMYIITFSIWFACTGVFVLLILSEKPINGAMFVAVTGATIFTNTMLLYCIFSVRK